MSEDKIATLQEVFAEQAERESNMRFRHPWVDLFYNWAIAIVAIALVLSLIKYDADIRQRRHDDAIRKETVETMEAERKAEAEAKEAKEKELLASEEAVRVRMARKLAAVYYGADKFREKYHYDKADFDTLGRCVFNRLWNTKFNVNQKEEDYDKNLSEEENRFNAVIRQDNQWVGYYDNNPSDINPYYEWALDLVETCRTENVKPISTDYLWAEYREDGIFLKNDYNADGYARRWRAS